MGISLKDTKMKELYTQACVCVYIRNSWKEEGKNFISTRLPALMHKLPFNINSFFSSSF